LPFGASRKPEEAGNAKPYFHDEAYGHVVYRIYTTQFPGQPGVLAQARALPGWGLGLAIVRRIADIHHGTVEAIPLQHGVKFRISVPETIDDRLV
jgi:hypothetical protein